MRHTTLVSLWCMASVLMVPGLASAQTEPQPPVSVPAACCPTAQSRLLPDIQPHAGSVAIGADFGFFKPDEELDTDLAYQAFVEIYPHRRLSLRIMGGWARAPYAKDLPCEVVELCAPTRSQDHLKVTANLVYNWEGEYWHPFVSAGVGLYSIRYMAFEDDTAGPRTLRTGFNLSGGVEYFWRPKVSVKVELAHHWPQPIIGLEGGTRNWVLTIGVKGYF